MNPGTSEMHFVAALDDVPEMRSVLALFEGVATGAADGYARMAGRPAAVLLHLGPGLGNGLANLHNARRGRTPMVNIVGRPRHLPRQVRRPAAVATSRASPGVCPTWIRSSNDPESVARDAADAVAAAFGPPGQVATLILPGRRVLVGLPRPRRPQRPRRCRHRAPTTGSRTSPPPSGPVSPPPC